MTNNKRKQVGLFFGSFNPIHVGHLIIANYMANYTKLDEVWFVISPHNPLKERSTLLDDYQRLEMLNMAVENSPKLKVCDIEFRLPKPSYTINTLTQLFDKHPDKDFSIIMGGDNLRTFHKWKSYKSILELTKLYVYPRPGIDMGELANHPQVTITEAPLMEISSSFIRKALKNGKSINYMVPEKVEKFILDMHFYEK